MKKTVRRNITLDSEIDRKAHALAKYSNRKLSNLIELYLRRAITEMELNGLSLQEESEND